MLRVPASTTPVPTGAEPASPLPEPGTLGLLLLRKRLNRKIVHDRVPSGPRACLGHFPFCGDGLSSLFCEFETRPVLLWENRECSMMRRPPELVPEYASAL